MCSQIHDSFHSKIYVIYIYMALLFTFSFDDERLFFDVDLHNVTREYHRCNDNVK